MAEMLPVDGAATGREHADRGQHRTKVTEALQRKAFGGHINWWARNTMIWESVALSQRGSNGIHRWSIGGKPMNSASSNGEETS